MKKVLLSIAASAVIAITTLGQAPQAFKYQAVVRDASNTILTDQAVGFQLVIQQGSIGGTAVYTETFTPTSNSYGIINIEIGTGTTADDFSTIDWANDSYFLETAIDVSGGSSYVVMGASQFLSVPYALHAKTADNAITDNVDDADADPTNELQNWSNLPGIPADFSDGTDDVDDADNDPTNELQNWSNLPGIPAGFSDGVDNVDDADADPTNEIETWGTLAGIPADLQDGDDNTQLNEAEVDAFVANNGYITSPDDADADPTNELQHWSNLPGIPAGFSDNVDDVNDADADPTNELQHWFNLPGIPPGFSDGTDNVDDADNDPTNEIELPASGTTDDVLTWDGSAWVAQYIANDADWSIDGSGNMSNANIGTVSIGVDATVNGVTVGRGGGNLLSNTANGYEALYSNTIGYDNTANGFNALYSNTDGWENTANGSIALYSNTFGYDNTANGYEALYSNTNGDGNTANGHGALYSNTTGWDNTAIGKYALHSNTSSSNTATGAYALRYNAGSYNTASGVSALLYNTTGSRNSANGYRALRSNTTGTWNTANGYYSLFSNSTGNDNTAIGNSANSIGTAYDNSTGLGYNADNTASNSVLVGNSSVTSIGGQVAWTTLSDKRFKTDVRKDEVKGLEFITALEPVTYNYDIDAQAAWKEQNYGEKNTDQWEGKYDIEQIRFSGFIAQDVEKLARSIGYEFSGVDAPKNDKDVYGLRYAEFVVPLVKGMQEQQEQIEQQQNEIQELKEANASLNESIYEIKAHLNLQIKKE